LERVREARSRLMASNPRINPMRGPKKAMNCTSENNAPVDVKSKRNTIEGLANPSSSFRSPVPTM